MDDQELSRLLSSEERSRKLTEDERRRAMSTLGIGAHDGLAVSGTKTGSSTRPGWRRPALAALALAASILVALAVWPEPTGQTVDIIADEGQPDPFATPCTTQLLDVIEAIEQWRGIEAWAFSSDAEPDLAAELGAAFSAFGQIELIAGDVAVLADQLADDLAAGDDGQLPLLFAEATAKEAAVRKGLEGLAALLDSQNAGACDLVGLEAALSL